jgi:3-oxoacyl-[acyl-carrier-protein] synthase-3
VSFGLLSFGTTLGARTPLADVVGDYTEDLSRVLDYGYRNVHRSPADVGLTDLAVDAGRQALEAAGVAGSDVDLVVLATTDITEYLFWDGAASVAHRLGATRAEAVLLTQACTTGVVSFDAVAGKFATHPRYQRALLIAANRTCEAYWNRLDTQPMVFSDGAAAAVATRDHPSLRWLATEVLTDGQYADLYRMDIGGERRPYGVGGADPDELRARDAWAVMETFDYDPDRFEEFIAQLDEQTCVVIERACYRASISPKDLARMVALNDNRSAMTKLAERLGVPLDRTNLDLSLEYGHLGAADQLFGLAHLSARNILTSGDHVVLVSRGRGMHWACTLLKA